MGDWGCGFERFGDGWGRAPFYFWAFERLCCWLGLLGGRKGYILYLFGLEGLIPCCLFIVAEKENRLMQIILMIDELLFEFR